MERPTAPLATVSDRLRLRELSFDDAPFVVELLSDPDFLRYIGDRGVRDEASARSYLEKGPLASYAANGFGLYAVVPLGADDVAGICGLLKRPWLDEPDLGFAFLPRFRGRGYAAEAARAVLADGARRLGLRRVAAIVSPGNDRSVRVLEKQGFRYERDACPPGESVPVLVFGWAADHLPAPRPGSRTRDA
jgi:RimJ/RimL family protein N-acetyltransferase